MALGLPTFFFDARMTFCSSQQEFLELFEGVVGCYCTTLWAQWSAETAQAPAIQVRFRLSALHEEWFFKLI